MVYDSTLNLRYVRAGNAIYLTDEMSFPEVMPAELTHAGVELHALNWLK